MMRSLFAGVTGLRNHQTRMDVIGNNIANVNTIGFKAGRVTFRELFYQTTRGASAPMADRGGTNPQQIGLGMAISGIDVIHGQGNLQNTGKMTDLSIQGNGFFTMADGQRIVYSRSGAFEVDSAGFLSDTSNGLRVQGWVAESGVLPIRDQENLADIRVRLGESINASPTDRIAFANNLNPGAATGETYVAVVDVFDSLGATSTLTLTFEKAAAPNTWNWSASGPAGLAGNSGTLTFNSLGQYQASTGGPLTFTPSGANPVTITPDFSTVTQLGGQSTVTVSERNGFPMGTLETFTIDDTGVITGVFSNGLTNVLGQVAITGFTNPGGLLKRGENLYVASNNSGLPQVGEAGKASRGTIAPGTLEMSNVDISKEFIEMIITQRGFQANSRIITTSDEMLQELVNIKR
ncbi:MAG: flagellar hook protein FlgE [Firmicutes bacterium]|nr:flagellar hook protein FlgE [Bacillota bacterium]